MMSTAAQSESKTAWFRHRFNGSLHEATKGSASYFRCLREQTQVDTDAGEVPEPVFERVSDSELKKLQAKPELLPGYFEEQPNKPRKGTVIIQQGSGPSEDEIQKRIEDGINAALEKIEQQKAEDAAKAEAEATEKAKIEQQKAEDAAKAEAEATEKAKTEQKGS